MIIETSNYIVLTDQDIKDITEKAAKFPEKSGSSVSSTIKHFVIHIKNVYGVDLNIKTKEMEDGDQAKLAKQAKERLKRNRKSSRRSIDDF